MCIRDSVKGVNYHEHNENTGHYVSEELMKKDFELWKRYNVNTCLLYTSLPHPEKLARNACAGNDETFQDNAQHLLLQIVMNDRLLPELSLIHICFLPDFYTTTEYRTGNRSPMFSDTE